MDDSVIMLDKIVESYKNKKFKKKTIPTNLSEKKATCKTKNLLTFSLITITLLIAVCIYCYLLTF